MKTPEFNLLFEEWIPVLYRDGRFQREGILSVLRNAHLIREIAASNPMDRFAVLRFLLAVLYWCKGNPNGADQNVAQFPVDWFTKIEEHRDCFNLLGDGKRFYQVKQARRDRPATDLLQEIPTGNNFWHFLHSTDGQEGLCPTCCALGLLRLPLYCVSGLPDLKSGINGTPPIYVFSLGNSLLHSLLDSWRAVDNIGEPFWTSAEFKPPESDSVPLLAGFTLPARLVWLHNQQEDQKLCHNCGRTDRLIHGCEYQSAGSQENKAWRDPHVLYREEDPLKSERAVDLTSAGRFRMDRPWPHLLQRLVVNKTNAHKLLLVGFATDKAKNVDVWERTVCLPHSKENAIDTGSIINWNVAGNRLADKARQKERKQRKDTPVELKSSITAFRPQVEHVVSKRATDLFNSGAEGWKQAASYWSIPLQAAARSLASDYTVEAQLRRAEIEHAIPRWSEPKSEEEKPKRTRGKKV